MSDINLTIFLSQFFSLYLTFCDNFLGANTNPDTKCPKDSPRPPVRSRSLGQQSQPAKLDHQPHNQAQGHRLHRSQSCTVQSPELQSPSRVNHSRSHDLKSFKSHNDFCDELQSSLSVVQSKGHDLQLSQSHDKKAVEIQSQNTGHVLQSSQNHHKSDEIQSHNPVVQPQGHDLQTPDNHEKSSFEKQSQNLLVQSKRCDHLPSQNHNKKLVEPQSQNSVDQFKVDDFQAAQNHVEEYVEMESGDPVVESNVHDPQPSQSHEENSTKVEKQNPVDSSKEDKPRSHNILMKDQEIPSICEDPMSEGEFEEIDSEVFDNLLNEISEPTSSMSSITQSDQLKHSSISCNDLSRTESLQSKPCDSPEAQVSNSKFNSNENKGRFDKSKTQNLNVKRDMGHIDPSNNCAHQSRKSVSLSDISKKEEQPKIQYVNKSKSLIQTSVTQSAIMGLRDRNHNLHLEGRANTSERKVNQSAVVSPKKRKIETPVSLNKPPNTTVRLHPLTGTPIFEPVSEPKKVKKHSPNVMIHPITGTPIAMPPPSRR